MKIYQKPRTKNVLLSASQAVMQVVETSTITVPVGGEDDPDNPDLANHNSIWDRWEEEGN